MLRKKYLPAIDESYGGTDINWSDLDSSGMMGGMDDEFRMGYVGDNTDEPFIERYYKNVHKTFEEAYKKLESEPDISISLTCAALEHLIRELCNDTNPCAKGDALCDLVSHILKEYEYFPSKELNANIRNVGSGILKIAQNAETIRSQYTKDAHGSLDPKYMQDQPLYAKLIFNSLTTIGLFFIGLKKVRNDQQNDDIPF